MSTQPREVRVISAYSLRRVFRLRIWPRVTLILDIEHKRPKLVMRTPIEGGTA